MVIQQLRITMTAKKKSEKNKKRTKVRGKNKKGLSGTTRGPVKTSHVLLWPIQKKISEQLSHSCGKEYELLTNSWVPHGSRPHGHDRTLVMCVNDPVCWKSTPVLQSWPDEDLSLLVPETYSDSPSESNTEWEPQVNKYWWMTPKKLSHGK